MSTELHDGAKLYLRIVEKAGVLDLHVLPSDHVRGFDLWRAGIENPVGSSIKIEHLEIWLQGYGSAYDQYALKASENVATRKMLEEHSEVIRLRDALKEIANGGAQFNLTVEGIREFACKILDDSTRGVSG